MRAFFRRKSLRLCLYLCLALTILAAALDSRLAVRRYTVRDARFSAPVRLLLITDLHACRYGSDQQTLLRAIEQAAPELIDAYVANGFDLVLSGHAHGGQWRLPGLLNGLYAPDQGIFPKYAGGRYTVGQTTLIVSRGLARETTVIPRIFNRPELVIVDLLPAEA